MAFVSAEKNPFQDALNWYVEVVGSVITVSDRREQCDLMLLADRVGKDPEAAHIIMKSFENQLSKGSAEEKAEAHGAWIAAAALLRYSHEPNYSDQLKAAAPVLYRLGSEILKAQDTV